MTARAILAVALAAVTGGSLWTPAQAQEVNTTVEVRVVLDEADAVIAILEQRSRGIEPTEEDWRRLQSSEGYVRLKRRQESFGATGFDESFREYLTSEEPLHRLPELREALVKWRSIDFGATGEQAGAYLPRGTEVRATVYPVIKRTPNSFVFELGSDPAIFMYVDPERTPMHLENTLAHELHHVGSATCPDPDGLDSLAPGAQRVVSWLSAFGEGMAVLAAAGGPDVHPHATSPPELWSIWERDIGEFAADLMRIQGFFQEVLAGHGTTDEQRAKLFSFINTEEVPAGGFYTVGWKMAALVERVRGREVVVRAVCDPRVLLTTYNEVAASIPRSDAEPLPLWDEDFLAEIVGDGKD
jgi:hypothetical protein